MLLQDWYKGFVKNCPSGEMTKEQLSSMYIQLFPSGHANKFMKNVFRTFGTNNKQAIDFREFMLALHQAGWRWDN